MIESHWRGIWYIWKHTNQNQFYFAEKFGHIWKALQLHHILQRFVLSTPANTFCICYATSDMESTNNSMAVDKKQDGLVSLTKVLGDRGVETSCRSSVQ